MKGQVQILVLAVAVGLPGAQANLLQNGSFESYAKTSSTWSTPNIVDFDLDVGNTDITGWTVIKGKIDYITRSNYTWQAADGNRCLDLCGNPGSGGISQTFPTEIGTAYEIQFSISGNPMTGYSGDNQPNKTVRIQAAGQSADFSYDRTVEDNSFEDMKWKLCTFTFVADSNSATLEIFSTMDIIKIGPVIDNISVVSVPSYSPAGSYGGVNIMGEHLLTTIVPMDSSGTTFSIVSDVISPGTSRTTARGQIVKTGHNTYSATQLAYMTDDAHNLTSKVVVSGDIVQKSDDDLEATWAAAVYAPDENPFAEGTVPLLCFPGVIAFYQRVPIAAPCEPLASP